MTNIHSLQLQRRPKLRVAVLYGGDSAEREVSLESGQCVAAALRQAGHAVRLWDPTVHPWEQLRAGRFHACFIALHGGAGEDGRVQARLEQLGIPYTGSGPAASRLAMSKSASKERFAQSGVPTLPYVLLHVAEPLAESLPRTAHLGLPLVVKPDAQGSSLGVLRVDRPDQLSGALRHAGEYDPFCLVEPFLTARELTVAVWNDHALPAIEIETPRRWFDYSAKYADGGARYHVAPSLPGQIQQQLETTALAAAAALGTRGMVRVDLLLDADQRAWVLEVNTVPGMTSHSLVPMAAARAGLDMPRLCDQLVRETLSREALSRPGQPQSSHRLLPHHGARPQLRSL